MVWILSCQILNVVFECVYHVICVNHGSSKDGIGGPVAQDEQDAVAMDLAEWEFAGEVSVYYTSFGVQKFQKA